MMSVKKPTVVPMLDLKAQHARIADEVMSAVERVFASQQFILGPEVKEFEAEIAAFCGAGHAIGCASGSDALLLALMGCGISEGDEVITTPFTFFATAGSIARLGARPVFVDIEPGTFNIDPGQIEAAVTPRTRAIMPVHLFGQPANMSPITTLAERYGLFVIEDAAQALGAKYEGRSAGTLGLVGAFSFYPTKNLGGAGDGGIMTTDNAEVAGLLRELRAHGARKKYFHERVGVNSRLDSIQAAILRAKLPYLEEWTARRRENASIYRDLFSSSGLIEEGAVGLPREIEGVYHVYNQFVIRCSRRDELRDYLTANGVGTEIYYPLPLHLQECFEYLGFKRGDLPESEKAANEALALPVYPELPAESLEHVVETIKEFYRKEAKGR